VDLFMAHMLTYPLTPGKKYAILLVDITCEGPSVR